MVGLDPALAPLADNGGATPTRALGAASPAIDTGSADTPDDQRGSPRRLGTRPDMGAYERARSTRFSVGDTSDIGPVTAEDCVRGPASACSLRDAVAASNRVIVSTDVPADDIVDEIAFDPSLGGQTITLVGPALAPAAAHPVKVDGSGLADAVTIDGDKATRTDPIFSFDGVGGQSTISKVELTGSPQAAVRVTTSKVAVSDSTIASNDAPTGGAGIEASSGSEVTITNSTITGNSTELGSGAVRAIVDTTLVVDSSTIAGNTSDDSTTGGIVVESNSTAAITNSILANEGRDISVSTDASASLSASLLQNDTDTGDRPPVTDDETILDEDPALGVLARNGGPARTMAIDPASPAYDAGRTDLTLDQRGVHRPEGTQDDMGAFEYNVPDTFTVNDRGDATPSGSSCTGGGSPCMLRQAIDAANREIAADTGEPDRIDFDQSIDGRTIFLKASLRDALTVTAPVAIDASALGQGVIVDGSGDPALSPKRQGDVFLFDASGDGSEIKGLELIGGTSTNIHLENSGVSISGSTVGAPSTVDGDPVWVMDRSTLALSNSTITGGQALAAWVVDSTLVTDSTTIAGNAFGILLTDGSTGSFTNSILADNGTRGDVFPTSDSSASLQSSLLETVPDTPGTAGPRVDDAATIIGKDPALGPLADNGGPTPTMSLRASSPAVDSGTTDLATDQRGSDRPLGAADDMGAFELDPTAPDVSLDAAPAARTADTGPEFVFSTTDPDGDFDRFECAVDGAGFSACESPFSPADPLADGAHSFGVRAVDRAGNESDAVTAAFTVDTLGPSTSIDSSAADRDGATVTFSSGAPDLDGFECSIDGSGFSGCTTPATFDGLSDGAHTIRVRAVDDLGNTGPAEETTVTVDTTTPADPAPSVPPPGASPPPASGTPAAPQPPAAQPAPVAAAAPAAGELGSIHPAKLRVRRARVLRGDRALDVFAPLTSRASGEQVDVAFRAAGRTERFEVEVSSGDAALARLRFRHAITRAQADVGTGIVTIDYQGNAVVRPQRVRLRAARNHADLEVGELSLQGDRLSARGSLNDDARGVVRLELSYLDARGTPQVFRTDVEIDDGAWAIDGVEVPPEVATRGAYVSVLFTGYFPRRIRGEMVSYEIGPGQTRNP